jgi:hypothetical protein
MQPLAPEPEVCFAMFSYHSFAPNRTFRKYRIFCALGIDQNGSYTTCV